MQWRATEELTKAKYSVCGPKSIYALSTMDIAVQTCDAIKPQTETFRNHSHGKLSEPSPLPGNCCRFNGSHLKATHLSTDAPLIVCARMPRAPAARKRCMSFNLYSFETIRLWAPSLSCTPLIRRLTGSLVLVRVAFLQDRRKGCWNAWSRICGVPK